MTQAIKNLSTSEGARPIIFRSLLAAVFLMAGIYVYFISLAVSNSAQSGKISQKIAEIEHQKIELEKKYIKLAGKLDVDYAYTAGFQQPKEVAYVARYDAFAQR